jgi:hypothetical protein
MSPRAEKITLCVALALLGVVVALIVKAVDDSWKDSPETRLDYFVTECAESYECRQHKEAATGHVYEDCVRDCTKGKVRGWARDNGEVFSD